MKSAHQKYLVAEENGLANANRDFEDSWERFIVKSKGSSQFSFKAWNGKYLVAEPDGRLNANRGVPDIWETFTVFPIENNKEN